MANLVIRLDRIAHRFRPATCWSAGRTCITYQLTDGTDRLSAVPSVCPECHRPTEARVIELVGVDIDRI